LFYNCLTLTKTHAAFLEKLRSWYISLKTFLDNALIDCMKIIEEFENRFLLFTYNICKALQFKHGKWSCFSKLKCKLHYASLHYLLVPSLGPAIFLLSTARLKPKHSLQNCQRHSTCHVSYCDFAHSLQQGFPNFLWPRTLPGFQKMSMSPKIFYDKKAE